MKFNLILLISVFLAILSSVISTTGPKCHKIKNESRCDMTNGCFWKNSMKKCLKDRN